MSSGPIERSGRTRGFPRALILGVAMSLAVAACSSANATLPLGLTMHSTARILGATATPTQAPTPTATAAPTDTPTPAPPTPVVTAAPRVTPLPPLAIGLCRGQQLTLAITLWTNDGTTSYAHITATNGSSANCNMRGTPQIQIVDGHGAVIGDAGAAGGEVKTGDPVHPLAPNGTINDIVTWGNWCKAAPAQSIRVAVVMPFGLGRMVAPPLGAPVIPSCLASSQGTSIKAEKWLP